VQGGAFSFVRPDGFIATTANWELKAMRAAQLPGGMTLDVKGLLRRLT
jgi:hypothetical protein